MYLSRGSRRHSCRQEKEHSHFIAWICAGRSRVSLYVLAKESLDQPSPAPKRSGGGCDAKLFVRPFSSVAGPLLD